MRFAAAIVLLLVEFALVMLFAASGRAQTSPRATQISGIPASAAEVGWCPGEPLHVAAPQTLEIGPRWSAAAPCYAHFNLILPAGVDPLSVSTFTAPARVSLSSGAWSDDLYIYLQAPIFSSGVLTQPQRIVIQTHFPANLTCTNCVIETAAAGAQMFPAFSMPVGLARVSSGVLHPALDPIINSHQLYIGAGLGVAVRRDGAGFWIELTRNDALLLAASTAATQMEIARTRNEARALLALPTPDQRLAKIEARLSDLHRQVQAIGTRTPARPNELEEARRQIEEARQGFQELFHELEQRANVLETAAIELSPETVLRVDRTARAGAPCGEPYGFDGHTPLVCEAGKWKRFKTK